MAPAGDYAVTPHSSPLTPHGFFVTGTDTGVGKTLIACGLLRAYARLGVRAAGMKPVAAGAAIEGGRLVNDDVKALVAAGNVAAREELVNPYCFAPGIAPHIAAAHAGVVIDIDRVKRAFLELAARCECVIVEGAGGFRVPLGPHSDMGDLAVALGLPVILVVGMRLGCINHALLTAAAIRAGGLTLAGWVANHVDPSLQNADENVEALAARLHAPMMGRVAFGGTADLDLVASRSRIGVMQETSAKKPSRQ